MRELKPLTEVEPAEMANPDFHVMVWPYAYGQFRIQIYSTRFDWPNDVPLRELCTYDGRRCGQVVRALREAEDPLKQARSYERPWNCEGPWHRIRLDTGIEHSLLRFQSTRDKEGGCSASQEAKEE